MVRGKRCTVIIGIPVFAFFIFLAVRIVRLLVLETRGFDKLSVFIVIIAMIAPAVDTINVVAISKTLNTILAREPE